MRINPISQNNQSFKAVNQKYYKRAEREIAKRGWITEDLLCCIRYDTVLWKEITLSDCIDTLNAIKNILKEPDSSIENDLKIYENMLKKDQSNQ